MARRRTGLLGATLLLVSFAGSVEAQDAGLIGAARQGDADAVQALLAGGADPSRAQGDGMTALHMAALEGHADVVAVLLGAGAEVGATTRIGAYTPLHLASQGGHGAVVRALLEKGADATRATTNSGTTPLHLAARVMDGEEAVAALLESRCRRERARGLRRPDPADVRGRLQPDADHVRVLLRSTGRTRIWPPGSWTCCATWPSTARPASSCATASRVSASRPSRARSPN